MAGSVVLSEQGLLPEGLMAEVALVGSLAGVGHDVVFQVALNAGRIGAEFALEALLTVVGPRMNPGEQKEALILL